MSGGLCVPGLHDRRAVQRHAVLPRRSGCSRVVPRIILLLAPVAEEPLRRRCRGLVPSGEHLASEMSGRPLLPNTGSAASL